MKPDMAAMRMKTVFLLSCLLFEGDSYQVRGLERGHVSFHCSHSYAWSNSKYLCRDQCSHDRDRVITVAPGQTAESGRFSLQDQGNQLTVNISRLQLSDAGLYFCGVERVGFDTFIQVQLTVDEVPEPSTTDPPTPATTATTQVSSSPSASGSTRFTCETCTTGTNFTTGEELFLIPGTALCTGLGAAALLALLVAVRYFRNRRNSPKAAVPPRLSNSYFVPGQNPAVRQKSLAVSGHSALQPPKGNAAKSSKPAARPKQKIRQKHVTNAGRRPTSDIYENVDFHKGAASLKGDAANVHDVDDTCAIYNNV